MTNYTTSEAYEAFVGSITPQEFIQPYLGTPDPVASAIAEIETNWVWEVPAPENLASLLKDYVDSHI